MVLCLDQLQQWPNINLFGSLSTPPQWCDWAKDLCHDRDCTDIVMIFQNVMTPCYHLLHWKQPLINCIIFRLISKAKLQMKKCLVVPNFLFTSMITTHLVVQSMFLIQDCKCLMTPFNSILHERWDYLSNLGWYVLKYNWVSKDEAFFLRKSG